MRRLIASALVAVMASDGCALQARRRQAGVPAFAAFGAVTGVDEQRQTLVYERR